MMGPPRGPVCLFSDPNNVLHCHVTGTCTAAFLFMVLQYFLFAYKGESEDPFALGFRKGNGHGTVYGCGAGRSWVGIWRYWYQCIPTIHTQALVSLIWLPTASGRHCVLCHVAEYLEVLGVNGLRGLEILAPQSVSTSLGYIPC